MQLPNGTHKRYSMNDMVILFLKIAVATIFALAVFGKLTGRTKSTFERAGYTPEVMHATAVIESILTVVLFTKYDLLATLGLLGILGGAWIALLRQKAKLAQYAPPSIAAVLLSVLLCLLMR